MIIFIQIFKHIRCFLLFLKFLQIQIHLINFIHVILYQILTIFLNKIANNLILFSFLLILIYFLLVFQFFLFLLHFYLFLLNTLKVSFQNFLLIFFWVIFQIEFKLIWIFNSPYILNIQFITPNQVIFIHFIFWKAKFAFSYSNFIYNFTVNTHFISQIH